jgi:hypothetical protein
MPSGKSKKKKQKGGSKIKIGGIAEREKAKAKREAEASAKREADEQARKNSIVLVRSLTVHTSVPPSPDSWLLVPFQNISNCKYSVVREQGEKLGLFICDSETETDFDVWWTGAICRLFVFVLTLPTSSQIPRLLLNA